MKRVIKVKKKTGDFVAYSVAKVKDVLKSAGFTGGLLIKATSNVFSEVKNLTKKGIISAADLEKAIVRGVNNKNPRCFRSPFGCLRK